MNIRRRKAEISITVFPRGRKNNPKRRSLAVEKINKERRKENIKGPLWPSQFQVKKPPPPPPSYTYACTL